MPKQNVPPQLAVPSDKGTPDSCRSSNTNTPTFETEVNGRDSKRQKLNAEHGKRSVMQLDASDYADTNAANQCAFCHSCRTTEVTGPLLHYYGNGKPVKVEEADQTTVIHVHDQCVDWTPRVYFDGETAMNLKAEVSRASKLRCSNCGQKGAALGCFYKTCRRSYHIPCAFGIPQCRWDLNCHAINPRVKGRSRLTIPDRLKEIVLIFHRKCPSLLKNHGKRAGQLHLISQTYGFCADLLSRNRTR